MMGVLFQAKLEFMPLHDILQWIEMNRLSCVVAITLANDSAMSLYLEEGKIVFVASPKRGNRLGESLVKSGALNEAQVFKALTESRKSGTLFSRYLVENGLISCQALNEVFAQLVEKILVEVLMCQSGSVDVTTPLPDFARNGPLRMETGKAVFEAVRLFDELTRKNEERDAAIEAINQRLYREEFQLPVLPTMIMQLISLMEDEKTTFQEMARLIMTDQVLISRILKVANSPYYGGAGQVDSIHFAIVRLGMREIVNIVTGLQINAMACRDIPQDRLQTILDDALKTAFMASGLARHCRLDPEEAFLGGLLLDLGKTVILSVAKDFQIEQSLLDELLDSRHAEIGTLIARKWNYPESIQHLIRYHHTRNIGGIVNRLVALIQIADHLVRTGSEKGLDPQLLPGLALSAETVMDVHTQAIESFNQIKAI